MHHSATNVDPSELEKFDLAANRWWDPESEFKPLHDINPIRLDYIEQRLGGLSGHTILDVGCGGGLLAEGMAHRGARVTGIDLAPKSLQVAELHALETGASVTYERIAVEEMAQRHPGAFDAVTCLELLEHVPDPASVIKACATLVKPGGNVFLSTLNRTAKAYALAIVGAEYVMKLIPKGTHDYQQFIRPSELANWSRAAGLELANLKGLYYNPLTRDYGLNDDVSVNYLAHFVRHADAPETNA